MPFLLFLPNVESESLSSQVDLKDGLLDSEGLSVQVKKISGTPSVSSSCLFTSFPGIAAMVALEMVKTHKANVYKYMFL